MDTSVLRIQVSGEFSSCKVGIFFPLLVNQTYTLGGDHL